MKGPILELGETRKYIDILDAGVRSLDYTHKKSKDFAHQYAGFTKYNDNKNELVM